MQKCNKEQIYESIDLQEHDVILYLGGRIDDDNLYPPEYVEYLKDEVERLNPTKIICHNYWYAKKYYEKGILAEDTKIDMILNYFHYFLKGDLQTINPAEYSHHRSWIKILTEKNPNLVYALYMFPGKTYNPNDPKLNGELFGEDYNLNNLKYFNIEREYSPKRFDNRGWTIGSALSHGDRERNATDGFSILTGLVDAGFRNLNILGFTAFGSDEDQSHHTAYKYERFAGQKYFNLNTSEDQKAEADILQSMTLTGKINNLENYDKLMQCLKEK